MPPRRCPPVAFAIVLWAMASCLRPALAEPVPADAPAAPTVDAPAPLADLAPGLVEEEVPAVVLREASEAVIGRQIEHDRRLLLEQGYEWRPPTWIQRASVVNLGDFPALHDPSADAERRLRTLEWLMEDRERRAREAGGARPAAMALPEASWLRLLLPGTWAPVLRENREVVIAGGMAVLLLSWGLRAVPRSLAPARRTRRRRADVAAPATPAPASKRHRRRRRLTTSVRSSAQVPLR